MPSIFASLGTTIFEEMSQLAREHDAINLGQGFPDTDGPEDIRRAAADAVMSQSNQYPPMMGLPALRAAVADHYRRFQGISVEPADVLITSGATEALAAAILAFVEPGDEVVLIQPMYDAYRPIVLRAGGVPRYLTLSPPDWRLDADEIERSFATRPRMVVFNNPLNPAGRVFEHAEIALLADACRRHGVLALCDEVWEHIVFDGRRHHPLIAEPGMADLAIKVGSAGKIFSMTGWKVGFVVAAERLMAPIARAHQYLTFTTPPALQAAVTYGLDQSDAYLRENSAALQSLRDRLAASLSAAGFCILPSQGTYFLCVDLAASGVDIGDRSFCLEAVRQARVAAIPLSSFYAEHAQTNIVRLCFAKAPRLLDQAADRLRIHLASK